MWMFKMPWNMYPFSNKLHYSGSIFQAASLHNVLFISWKWASMHCFVLSRVHLIVCDCCKLYSVLASVEN